MDITLWPTRPDDLRVPPERAKQSREHCFYGSSWQIAAPVEHHLSLAVHATGFVGSPAAGSTGREETHHVYWTLTSFSPLLNHTHIFNFTIKIAQTSIFLLYTSMQFVFLFLFLFFFIWKLSRVSQNSALNFFFLFEFKANCW